jgi:hypothetical protein
MSPNCPRTNPTWWCEPFPDRWVFVCGRAMSFPSHVSGLASIE